MHLTIEKLVYGGDGLARLATEAESERKGKAIFVPFVLPGEGVEGRITEEKPGFARALAEKIVSPSSERIDARCPYFGYCGGCHYQHTRYEHQLAIKDEILRETLRRIAKVDLPQTALHPSPPWDYRNRARMKVLGGKNFVLGYYRFGSHDLLPVAECPISSPLINRAIAMMWALGREGMVTAKIFEVEFFANAEDTQLMLEVNVPDGYWTDRKKPTLLDTVAAIRAALPAIEGVSVFKSMANGSLVREDVPEKLRELFGEDVLEYHAANALYHVSAGSFFQTNRFLADTLVRLVAEGQTGDYALDLYAGTGLFSLALSQQFREVAAVEAAPFSVHDLKQNCPTNVSVFRSTTEKFLSSVAKGTASFDYVVMDPPRAGLGDEVARRLADLAPERMTYVSCDPATLARDLRVLLEKGYRIEQAHLADLFPQTFHIESVMRLTR